MLPLLAEGHDKKAQDPVILRLQVIGNPDHHIRLPYIDSQGTVDPIPPTENNRNSRGWGASWSTLFSRHWQWGPEPL